MKLTSTIEDLAAEAQKLGATKFIAKFGNAEKVFNDLSNAIKKGKRLLWKVPIKKIINK